MIKDLLQKRRLPDPLTFLNGEKVKTAEDWRRRRSELLDILCEEEYGRPLPPPLSVRAEILEENARFCAGKALLTKLRLTAETEKGGFSFPIYSAVPNGGQPCPAFLHINFRDAVPDMYMPTEEICDRGFAVFSFCYKDVTSDDGDFSDGLARFIDREPANAPGKIAVWSRAATYVMDYMQTLDEVDKNNIAVVGHSRLGKTALLTGALDERFAFTISNDSGCGGAAVTREKLGERVANICGKFYYWFCENYRKYISDEASMPFDQHFLLSAIAPRRLYVASAEDDIWADPESEFLSCAAAAEVYELLGEKGLVCPDALPKAGEYFHEGSIGYHMRSGCHYLSRYDWNRFMDYMLKHKN